MPPNLLQVVNSLFQTCYNKRSMLYQSDIALTGLPEELSSYQ
jgi:hypothetical protein